MISKERFVLIILLITNLIFLGILIHTISENKKYKSQMLVMTQYAAALEVLDDLDRGTLRLYELRKGGEREYTNHDEGPFEIWRLPFYPILGKPSIEAQEAFVQMYNDKMKTMHEKMQRKAERDRSP